MDEYSNADVTFEGNNNDLFALAGAILAGGILLSCVPGLSCFWPLLPAVLGIIGLFNASQSVKPSRTRKLAWVGIGASLFYLAIIFVFIAFYFFIIFFAILAEAS